MPGSAAAWQGQVGRQPPCVWVSLAAAGGPVRAVLAAQDTHDSGTCPQPQGVTTQSSHSTQGWRVHSCPHSADCPAHLLRHSQDQQSHNSCSWHPYVALPGTVRAGDHTVAEHRTHLWHLHHGQGVTVPPLVLAQQLQAPALHGLARGCCQPAGAPSTCQAPRMEHRVKTALLREALAHAGGSSSSTTSGSMASLLSAHWPQLQSFATLLAGLVSRGPRPQGRPLLHGAWAGTCMHRQAGGKSLALSFTCCAS